MRQVPLLDLKRQYLKCKQRINSGIAKSLEHQRWILGPEVDELEQRICDYLGVENCVAVASGTDALVLALRAFAIRLGKGEFFDRADKIITTPFTFTATADAILRAGATPVFVDIEPGTFNIDPDAIRDYLESDPENVVGIVPVHLYGQSCRMDRIMELAEDNGLFVMEDLAQAIGGKFSGRMLGSFGDAAAISFFPSKNLGGFGDGGMIATKDAQITELCRMLLKHGGKSKYDVSHLGYNSRLDTLQAAVLLAKFGYLDEFNDKRRQIAAFYDRRLSGIDGLTCPYSHSEAYHVYHQYTIRLNENLRDHVKAGLAENGVETAVYYPVALHKMELFQRRAVVAGSLENSEAASRQVLSLPVEPLLND